MTTGEKLAALRKKRNFTQEQLADILNVSRQSVSRWEMDIAFPETEKLIKLSKILECSIDYLLLNEIQNEEELECDPSVNECYKFIRDCGYFFLCTANKNKPNIRPMGMIYSDAKALYIATDKRKNVYAELINNPQFVLASYNLNSNRWIRINGRAKVETSNNVRNEMITVYPMIRQEYIGEEELFFVVFKLLIESIDKY